MVFTNTKREEFSILKNYDDNELEVIRHNHTGYYNITKIANLINKLKETNPISEDVAKGAKKWFQNQFAKELVKACRLYSGEDIVYYELDNGTPNRFIGIYVHEFLFHHFIIWLDKTYAIRVSQILNNWNVNTIMERMRTTAEDCANSVLDDIID